MTLNIKEVNTANFISNSIKFHFEDCFDKKTKKSVVNRLLDFLITWYTGKKNIFSNSIEIRYSTHCYILASDCSSYQFFDIVSHILDDIGWKE